MGRVNYPRAHTHMHAQEGNSCSFTPAWSGNHALAFVDVEPSDAVKAFPKMKQLVHGQCRGCHIKFLCSAVAELSRALTGGSLTFRNA